VAQLILSRAGAALGARLSSPAFRAFGAQVGRWAGAALGGRIDEALFGPQRISVGARLTEVHVQESAEGAGIPNVYGRVRLAGQLIWSAPFKERSETSTDRPGGKWGAAVKTTRRIQTVSFAVGLAEGVAGRIDKAWANGEQIDLSRLDWRFHPGTETQAPDPLIEASEGAGATPAYRGLAYVVFEDFPLPEGANFIPQMSFEMTRSAPRRGGAKRLEDAARAVCLIPGAGEFVLASEIVRRRIAEGEERAENAHAEAGRANLLVSLDQLEADLPNVDRVMLVVGWFGDDLAAGRCKIRPGVEIAAKETTPLSWRVNGVPRAGARLVSSVNGAPAYGGTPSDQTVVQAIRELKGRGYKVGLCPFLFMDVPPGNGLPDPYGGAEQAAFPWRGRITLAAAPGRPGSVDRTLAAAAEVAAFFGAAAPADMVAGLDEAIYQGPDEWGFRRFILHHARLAALAGGVDLFVIGSELRGLTTIRSGPSTYPAVAALKSLAADVRAMLPAPTKLTYGADWSEYFGHQPADGSGDVHFHLDPLWADPTIDAVGIDYYPPLADWREGEHLDAALASSAYDPSYLAGQVRGGEQFDYFYASEAARMAQARTPIADGAHGEHWLFRPKDLRGWWENPHHDRPGGVRAASPTAWTPRSKPIWLLEAGCPAIDKGANAPNLFVDPKSAESKRPPFSTGARDDLIQRATLEAVLTRFDGTDPDNPISPLYGGPMVDPAMIHLWCWDGRPFPHFPDREDAWADGPAWAVGHWLNGRAGAAPLSLVIADLCARAGHPQADVSAVEGIVPGYIVDAPTSARAAIEPLMAAYDLHALARPSGIRFAHRARSEPVLLTEADLVDQSEAAFTLTRDDVAERPLETRLRYIDARADHRIATASARRRDAIGAGVTTIDAALALAPEQAQALVERLHARALAQTQTLAFAVPRGRLALEPGDRVRLTGVAGIFAIERIEDVGGTRALTLQPDPDTDGLRIVSGGAPRATIARPALAPAFHLLDLPTLPGAADETGPWIAAHAEPWPGAVEVFAGAPGAGKTLRARIERPAIRGRLEWALWPGPIGRWDDGNIVRVRLSGEGAASESAAAVLDGENLFAVEGAPGRWELLQARRATLVGPGLYELAGLLRGQLGSEAEMAATAPAGAPIVRIDQRLTRAIVMPGEIGADLEWIAAEAGQGAGAAAATKRLARFLDRARRPLAPAHLRAVRGAGGDITLSWIRRGRIDADAWAAGDVPLAEEAERYRLDILAPGGALLRSVETTAPVWTYPAALASADHGGAPTSLSVRLAQISPTFGAGAPTEAVLWL
jgi:hypothetical protein